MCHRYSCNCFPPDGHLDVDQVNCHPRFLFALVRDCGTILPAEYAALQDYVERCDAIFATEGLPKTLGKRLAARLLYGGSEARWRRDTGHTATLSAWWPAFKLEIKKLLRHAWDAAGTN